MTDTENKPEQSGNVGGSGSEDKKVEAPKPAPKKDPRDKLFKSAYNLVITSSPHDYHQGNVPRIMWSVVAALMPATIMGIYLFQMKAVVMILAVTAAAVITEMLMNKIRGKEFTVKDGSAAITGLLLALTLPPDLPVFHGVLGSIFGIIIGKHIYGGLGYNIFNPALLGRAFLQASFPVAMTTWTFPSTYTGAVDGVTAATPLGILKFGSDIPSPDYMELLYGTIGGSIGETSAIAILAGGIFLLIMKYADWRIPVSFISSVFVFGGLIYMLDTTHYPDPLYHLLSGGLLLGAFFMATDMVTSPITPLGSWVFGIAAGLILVVIRVFGGLPEGVMFTILLMNGFTPLINRYTRPRYLGEVTK